MTDDTTDARLAVLLAPAMRTPDERFAASVARLVDLDHRLERRARAGRQRAMAAILALLAAVAGLARLGAMPAVAERGSGIVAPAALILMLLVLAAQSPALGER